jgi:hypothetical protein
MGLSRFDFRVFAPYLKDSHRLVLQRLFEALNDQSEWVVKRTAAMRDEAERIALIGQTMKRAGLRSYTDEHGRIFVAGDT